MENPPSTKHKVQSSALSMSEALSPNTAISHYRTLSKLGAGGMGEVWLAEDTRLGRKVALKLLPAEFTENSERVRRFTQEAKAASALNHPNIISVYDIGECESGRFIVMEFVAGKTLRSVITSDNSPETFFALGHQMARGLSAAHAAGITHRDIKPDNIMVRDDGYIKMLDFGLARLLPTTSSDPEAMTLAQQTTPGTVMGTLAYMSPEQASGESVGSSSDVFALGIVLYELATGHHPFKSDTMIGYLHAITTQSPPSLSSHKSDLPVALDDLILRMLEKDANSRPTSSEVAQALQEIEKYGTSKTLPIRVTTSKSRAPFGEEGFWVAVLPFKYRGSNSDIEALAEGLSEDIITGLNRFSYLRVIARSSTLQYASQTSDVRTVGRSLGARYVMEGNLRQAGTKMRLAVQLIDAITGAHLWAENYERTFSPESIFELQDELVPKIVSTVADLHGVLPRSMSEAVRGRPPEQLSPYEAVLRSFSYAERVTPETLADAIIALESAVEKAPAYADAWAMLAAMLAHDYAQGFNLRPDSLISGEAAAHSAIELAPSNHLAWFGLAQVHFFQKELQSFRNATERAVALNPMDGNSLASLGELLVFIGEGERGLELVERAKHLNPHHPGWYWYADFYQAYRQRDYRSALSFALKVNLPGHWAEQLMIAAASGQLGEHELAAKAVVALLKLRPDAKLEVRTEFEKWWNAEDVEHLMEGLRKAGLEETRGEKRRGESETGGRGELETTVLTSGRSTSGSHSGDSFSSLIKSIAVLPFKNLSGEAEQEVFTDGITEEILNALAQIRGLRVAGRSSSFSFKGRDEDLRSVGAKLNVGTLLEGTLRRSGDRLRITAQLIDAANGYQLWSERYDRVIDDVFSVQDEIAATIANRLQLTLSVEPASEQPPTRNIEAFELYLKGRSLLYQRGLSIAKAIDCFSHAVVLDPSYAQAWAGLADGYTTFGYSGYKPSKEVMPLALAAARRALALDENLAEAHSALACPTLLYERDYALAGREFVRAIELNPNYPQALAWYSLFYLLWVSGDYSRGNEELHRLLRIDPLSGYAHVMAAFFYSCSDRTSEAVEYGRRGVELDPNSYLGLWALSIALDADGQFEEAAAFAQKALSISGRHIWALCGLAAIYDGWNKPDAAREVYRELVERSASEYVQPAMLTIAASAVDDIDRSIQIAQQAVDERDPLFVMIARSWPQYRKLRSDPRFVSIVSKLELPNWKA
jgi:TolB-like protein/Tfp pilus assembly protein PilF